MATVAAPTYQDYFMLGRSEAAARRPELTFDEGDISEFDVAAAAAMADHLTGYASQRVRATFLDGAKGDDLTILADDRYNIQREDAQPATGVLTISRSSGALSGTIPAGTVFSTTVQPDGTTVQYTLDNDLAWAAQLTQDATVTAVVFGVQGNVDIAKVNQVTTQGLFDAFSCTNAARMAGGVDAESDDALRERCRGFTATLRRGTIGALEYGAKSVAGVFSATAVEPGDGTVNLYVADSSGGSSPTLVSNVQLEIDTNWRAAGVIVNVTGGAVYNLTGVNLTLSTRAGSGISTAAIAADIKAAVVARVNKLKIGETLSSGAIKAAAMSVDDNILDVTVNSPVGNVVPAANQIIRTTTGDITVS